ncbi:MAG: HlyD family efflux transporter periplasmic adaptor subunit [Lentisphaerae bacterium]|nr:HlyD family efflux transporter periplasmic adaptor subunit [Lentisphaerota bacterium]
MKSVKKNLLSGHSSVRNRFKVFRRIIAAILTLVVIIVLIMCFGSMNDTVEGNGTVVGIREYDLKTLVSAKTVKIYHHEGEEVKQGDLLVEFDSRDQMDKIAMLKHELEELLHEQEVKEQALKILRKDPLPDYFRHTKLQLEEAKERFARNEHELKVYADLFARKAITRREYLKVELDHLNSNMTLKRLSEDWKKLQSGMAKDILNKAVKELELLKKRIEGKRKEITVATKQLEDFKLFAPDHGVLTDIPPRPGGFYERGEVVVKFSANQNKKVIALIDEKQIFKVIPGQPVRIYCQQYNYLDYGFFSGRVTDIYQLPVKQNGANYYPVRIVLSDEQYPLRFGAGCEVTIVTGRDRIIFVLLGLRGKGFWERRRQHLELVKENLKAKRPTVIIEKTR